MFHQEQLGLPNTVTEDGYRSHTRRLFKRSTATDEYNINHAALGIAGEAGEVVDLIKKHVIYGKPLDRAKLVEELGDLLFYLDALVDDIGSSWDEIRDVNYNKLNARYPEGYSDKAAIERRDQE